jgi:hypothetical protein
VLVEGEGEGVVGDGVVEAGVVVEGVVGVVDVAVDVPH